MHKLIFKVLSSGIAFLVAYNAAAMVRYEDKYPKKVREIKITGYLDYAPFGYTENPDLPIHGKFSTVFKPMLDDFKEENNLKIIYDVQRKDFPALVQDVRRGNIDLVLGAYYQTELFKGLELVYPSILSNPLTVFTLPERIGDIKTTEDLKKLKGARISKEFYTDFVNEQIQDYNLEVVDDAYKLFELLFTKKVDYILVSQYYGLVEASKLGLRHHISVARQTVWKMPLFIGISKLSPHRRMIAQKLTQYSEKPENRKKIEQYLMRMIEEFDRQNQGVVPPTFGLENTDN